MIFISRCSACRWIWINTLSEDVLWRRHNQTSSEWEKRIETIHLCRRGRGDVPLFFGFWHVFLLHKQKI